MRILNTWLTIFFLGGSQATGDDEQEHTVIVENLDGL